MYKRFLLRLLVVMVIMALLMPACIQTPKYVLAMAVAPSGAGTATDETGTSPYGAGETVRIRAVAASGWVFANWSAPAGTFGNVSAPETTFTMPARHVTVTANFERLPSWFTLTVVADPVEGGVVVSVPAATTQEGTTVSVRAEASLGYNFSRWTSSPEVTFTPNATSANATFVMPSANITVTAHFAGIPPPAGWEPVELKFLIRPEDARLEMGHYLADLLERERFLTKRDIKPAADAGPIWKSTAAAQAGHWHVYTGGWTRTRVVRDEREIFHVTFGRLRGWGPYPLKEPNPALENVTKKLFEADYAYKNLTGMAARELLFKDALNLAARDALVVYCTDNTEFIPYRENVNVSYDLAGGIEGAWHWAHTVHFHRDYRPIKPTGTTYLRVSQWNILADPWNPIDGSNWIFDMMPIRATGDSGLMPHNKLGYFMPQRIANATVTIGASISPSVAEPHPVHGTWLTLERLPALNITVPDDAWADWCVVNKTWITAAERFPGPEARRALKKSLVRYPPGLWDIKWHDGSNLSYADFLMFMIAPFERGKPGGTFYDPFFEPAFEAWFATFRGYKVLSTNPLTIEFYSNVWTLDPCSMVSSLWPMYSQGPAGWHNLMLGIMAERDNELAFGRTKAQLIGKDWMNYIHGASLSILKSKLDALRADPAKMPYYDFFVANVPGFATEAVTRLANLNAWYNKHGNFWLGTGPFMLTGACPTAKYVELTRNPHYPDPGDKWFAFLATPAKDVPAHMGAWVDKIFMGRIVSPLQALHELNAPEPYGVHIHAGSIMDPTLYHVTLPTLPHVKSIRKMGCWKEFLFNPVLMPEDKKLNPFGVKKIREAISWLIDRRFIADVIYGGMATPKYTPLMGAFPEATERYPHLVKAMEETYAHNPAKAKVIIEAEMLAMGCRVYYSPAHRRAVWHFISPP